jgi:ATP-dependent Clp protease ATP-binding subunit ClpC
MTNYGLSSTIGRLLGWISSSIDLYGKRQNIPMSEGHRFDRFTRRAQKVLSLAQEEAQRLRHRSIGTEHLLLGLVREGEGVAAKVLIELGVNLEKVRKAVEDALGRGDRIVVGEIGLTPHGKKVIELAVDEARLLNHHYIGTEHLLLGLLREGDDGGSHILESFGLSVQEVRAKIIEILNKQRK